MTANHKITADHILVGDGKVLTDTVIITDNLGKIIAIDDIVNHDKSSIQKHRGTIIPGLINTHCHLELSHLKGAIPTGTGLVNFITNVVQLREVDQEIIDAKIKEADANMYANGIQAVGDISNKIDTADTKSSSPIAYYTFVEMFDFMNENNTQQTIDQYNSVFEKQSDTCYNKKSKVPHAPYSVSPKLFEYLANANEENSTISIHNQETPSENEMFLSNAGQMVDFFKNVGMPIESIPFKGIKSIEYALKYLNKNQKTLFVHNTQCTAEDIKKGNAFSDKTYWATCPNANLYIENTLPNYQLFIDQNCKMTIGTDSLSSNWQLSIWEEMKTILKYQSYVTFDQVLQWATVNGAKALGYEDVFGTISVGKTPGILLVDVDYTGVETDISNSVVKRII